MSWKVRRGDVRAAALSLLAEPPRNGYQIIQDISERSGGLWKPSSGSVYPALQQLEDEGLIRVVTEEGRRSFHLTEAGRTYVETHKEELAAPWDEVTAGVDDNALGLWQLIGQVSIAVAQVSQAGTPASLDLASLSSAGKGELPFSFQYYTDIEQPITLPTAFKPNSVTIEVRPSRKDMAPYRQTFIWEVDPI